jgi:hypothetical protein
LSQVPADTLLNITHIVGFRENAQQINQMICNLFPVPDNKFLISQVKDFVNSEQWDPSYFNHMFKSKTNLHLQPDARVMHLNNSLMVHGICNGTIGVITDVDPQEECVRIAFSVKGSIVI